MLGAARVPPSSRIPGDSRPPAHRQDGGMSNGRDDDDWVGTPPEGRYTRDRAKPEFWWRQRPVVPAAVGILVVLVIILIVALLS